MGKVYGYMRVSTDKQNDARQRVELLRHGVLPHNIFSDKASGKDFHRPQYAKLIKRLKRGDIITVKSLDRLGRNYQQIGAQWRLITQTIGADINVLDMPLLDTRKQKDLLGTLISDMVLMLLSYVAQQEREFIHQRQKEGIALARAKGVQFGRPKKPFPVGFLSAYTAYRARNITAKQACEQLGVTMGSFLWCCRKKQEEENTNA